jgi:hypothetical protein
MEITLSPESIPQTCRVKPQGNRMIIKDIDIGNTEYHPAPPGLMVSELAAING